jgi:hypothetical protein
MAEQFRTAAEAVRETAHRLGFGIPDYAAAACAEAACAHAEGVVQNRQMAGRLQWAEPGFREYLRRKMRHDLLDEMTESGYVPVSLPRETIRYMTGGLLDPAGTHEVPETGDWQTAAVTLEAGVRRPPVDRKAAVRAGILSG